MALLVPDVQLAAGLVDHPVADINDHAGLLGNRQKLVRRQQAARRVLPAQQRFEANDRPARRAVLRLIEQTQLVAIQRLPQVVIKLQLRLRQRVHGRLEEVVAVAAVVLGVIHRGVGVKHQLALVLAITGINGDADTQRHHQLVA